MMDTVIFLHAGGGIAMTMAGVGALKFFFSASESVKRVPDALERSATAQEKQAEAAEQSADIACVLHDLREGQEQMRLSMSALTLEVQDLKGQAVVHG